jgi:hypothetical protein
MKHETSDFVVSDTASSFDDTEIEEGFFLIVASNVIIIKFNY